MEFEELRGEVLEEMDERNERVLKHFFFRIGNKGIVGYENKLGKKKFIVWTDKPGILIGKGGKNVDILNKYSLAHIDGEKTKFTENITFSIIYKGINIYSKEHVCLERIETSIEDTQKITV